MTVSSSAVIGFPGLTLDFTLSGGSYQANFPQSNLLDNTDLKAIARTTDATTGSTVIKGSSAAALSCGVFGLIATNLDIDATIRLQLFSNANWTGSLLDTGVQNAFPGTDPFDGDWFYYDGTNYAVKSFQIDISDTTNDNGFIDIGLLEIATAVAVGINFSPGSNRGRRIRDTFSETPGGRRIFGDQPSARTWNGTFDSQDTETFDLWMELWRLNKIITPFIWMPHPDDPDHWPQTAMLARLVDGNPIATYKEIVGLNEIPLKLEQML